MSQGRELGQRDVNPGGFIPNGTSFWSDQQERREKSSPAAVQSEDTEGHKICGGFGASADTKEREVTMSRCLQINYDLVAPGRDYTKLYAYLKSFNGYSRPLESMWLVRTSKSTQTVCNELLAYVDSNDKLVVIDVTDDAWWTHGLPNPTLTWMHGHISATVKLAA